MLRFWLVGIDVVMGEQHGDRLFNPAVLKVLPVPLPERVHGKVQMLFQITPCFFPVPWIPIDDSLHLFEFTEADLDVRPDARALIGRYYAMLRDLQPTERDHDRIRR